MGRRTASIIGCVALVILVLPAMASANWTHKGKGELKENASITLQGELTLSTSAGNVTCPTTLGTTLTANSSTGDVTSLTVPEPSECDLSGSLAAVCGTNGVTKVEKTGTWALAADETDITITSIDVHYILTGCLIQSFRLKGNATASLDKTSAMGSATLSGTQTVYNSLGEESGSGELKGTLTVTPGGTYGVKTAPLMETRWTDGNQPLSEDGKLTLNGTFSFSGSGGAISCPATVKLLLESSTIEEGEEESEGEVESFVVASPSGCHVSGGYAATCSTNSIANVEQTGATTLIATEEDITIFDLVLDYKFEGCAITSLRVEGDPTISVDNPEEIGSATFSAGPMQVYNAAGEKLSTASVGGSASASPSATYQLAPVDPHPEETETEATEHELATEGCMGGGSAESPGLTHEGSFLAGPCHESFTGVLGFSYGGFGGFDCAVHSTVELTAEGGTMVELGLTTETCAGTGVLTGCTLAEDQLDGSPTITPTAAAIDISGIVLTTSYGGTCPLTSAMLTVSSLTATPDNVEAISTLTLSGSYVLDPSSGGTLSSSLTGELEAASPETIGIG
jgi:hypothetical protein